MTPPLKETLMNNIATTLKIMFYILAASFACTVYAIIFTILSYTTNQTCMQRGYDYSTLTWTLHSYCVVWDGDKQINIPLSNTKPR